MMKFKRSISISLFLFVGILLSACNSGSTSEKIWTPETDGVLSAAVSNTGHYVLLGTDSGKANLWDLKKKKSLLHSWQHQEENETSGIIAVDLSYDDKFALTAEENSLVWWRVSDGKVLGYWKIEGIKSIAISKDGQFGIIGFRDYAQYFSLKTSKTKFRFEHPDFVKAVAVSDDGRYALTGSDNAEAKLWSLKNGKLLHTWKYKTKLITVALSPDGKYAMTNAVLGETRVWKTKDGKLKHKFLPKRVTNSSAAFNSSGQKLVTGRVTQRIDLWSSKSGKQLKSWLPKKSDNWRPSSANIVEIGFTNKDKKIISVTSNGIIQRWNVN